MRQCSGSACGKLANDLPDPLLPTTVFRMCVLADLVEDEIYPAAVEMLEGTYWDERLEVGPPEYGDGGGSFEVGGGD